MITESDYSVGQLIALGDDAFMPKPPTLTDLEEILV